MCDEWMPYIVLELTIEQYHRLPRNSAYKYEYFGGKAHLTPRTKHYHALLDLPSYMPDVEQGAGMTVRPLATEDRLRLEQVFVGAFRTIQPFGSLDDERVRHAAHASLEKTLTGGDGPLIEAASFVAEVDHNVSGAIFVTLLPDGDTGDWDSYYWREPPPSDAVERRLGRPHLTWIFVSPLCKGQGVGTALLGATVRALGAQGFRELLTTFILGNDSSMLWHWRNGFRLLEYPGTFRSFRRRLKSQSP